MSTNDTLRGLLADSQKALQHLLHNVKASGKRVELGLAKVVADDVIDRIDAALSEPVSGGVVLLSDCVEGSHPEYGQGYFFTADAIRDVAALNGGAVAGQSPAAVLAAKGVSSRSLGAEFAAVLADNLQDLLITDDEPLESERGGE